MVQGRFTMAARTKYKASISHRFAASVTAATGASPLPITETPARHPHPESKAMTEFEGVAPALGQALSQRG